MHHRALKVVPMSQETYIALLDKYLAGTCTAQERDQVEAWIEAVSRDRDEWSAMSPDQKQKYLKALYGQLAHEVLPPPHQGTSADTAADLTPGAYISGRRRLRWAVAASLLAVAAVGVALYMRKPSSSTDTAVPRPSITWVTQSTGTGEIREVTLPDSTHVWLDAATSILYAKGFNQETREVFLNGEAFFEVAKDERKPFVIHTQDIETRVLGTRFNVSGYASDQDVQVAVVAGRVEVSGGAPHSLPQKTRLEANQLATYSKKDGELSKKDVADAKAYAGWRSGMLDFHHTGMGEVVRKLQHVYGLEIALRGEAIKTSRISGKFTVSQSPTQVIKSICLSIGATYHFRGNRVLITEKK
jgi:ferric-dicitrate binding protein FerR (iron transport regulator)